MVRLFEIHKNLEDFVSINKEVTDRLAMARRYQEQSDALAGMLYCRHALECMVSHKHVSITGDPPKTDNFISFHTIMQTIKPHLPRQVAETLYSINAQTRGSMHYQSSDHGIRPQHVGVVIGMIEMIYFDLFAENLLRTEQVVDEKAVLREALAKDAKAISTLGIDEEITEEIQHILKGTISLSLSALERGEKFATADLISIGGALIHTGRLNEAERLLTDIINDKNEDLQPHEMATISVGLGKIARQRGEPEQAEGYYKSALETYDKSESSPARGLFLQSWRHHARER